MGIERVLGFQTLIYKLNSIGRMSSVYSASSALAMLQLTRQELRQLKFYLYDFSGSKDRKRRAQDSKVTSSHPELSAANSLESLSTFNFLEKPLFSCFFFLLVSL